MNMCPNCTKPTNTKFCSKSCAASFNNRLRQPRTEESKAKTSQSVKNFCKSNPIDVIRRRRPEYTQIKRTCCSFCKSSFWSHAPKNVHYFSRLCSDNCLYQSKMKNANGDSSLEYKGNKFDSKWEVEFATFLDNHHITWIQPTNSLKWIDQKGKERKYYPDFYLPDYDLYLDPKNPLVEIKQEEKLNYIKQHYSNVVWGDLDHLKSFTLLKCK